MIPQLTSDEHNDMLIKTPELEEVKVAIEAMNPNGAAGPDGLEVFFILNVGRLLI